LDVLIIDGLCASVFRKLDRVQYMNSSKSAIQAKRQIAGEGGGVIADLQQGLSDTA